MNYTKQVFRGTAIIFISSVFTALLGYFFRAYMARSLTPHEYGLFFSVFAFIASIVPFKDLGLSITITRYIPEFIIKKEEDKIRESLFFLFIFQTVLYGTALVLLVMLNKFLATNYFHEESAGMLIIVLAIAFSFSTLHSLFNSANIGFKKINHYAFFQVLFSAALIASFHLLNIYGISTLNAALAYLISYFLTSFIQIFIFLKMVPGFLSQKLKFRKELIKELFGFSSLNFLAGFGKNLFMNNGTHILTFMSTLENVAFFNIAMPTANIISFLFKPFGTIMLQVSSEVNTINKSILYKPLTDFFRYIFAIFLCGFIVSFFIADKIIVLLYSEKYMAAALSFIVLIAGNALLALVELNQNLMLGLKKPKESMITSFVMVIINILVCVILIPKINYLGASIAFTIASLIGLVYSISCLGIFKLLAKSTVNFLLISFAGVMMFFIINYLPHTTYLEIGISMACGGLAYLSIILLTKAITISEIMSTIKKAV